jgi:hypothetical protein
VHLSLHQRAVPDRISSPLRRNNDNTDDTPTQPDLLAWTRNFFFNTRNRRNDEVMELQEHRPAVVDVPLARGTQVSPPFVHRGRSCLHMSSRGTPLREKYGGSERKRERKRGKQRLRRQQRNRRQRTLIMQRTRRALLRVPHALPRTTSPSNPAERL